MAEWRRIQFQVGRIVAGHGPELAAVYYPKAHPGDLVAACHCTNRRYAGGAVIRVRVAWAWRQNERRMDTVENRFEIVLEGQPCVWVARREGIRVRDGRRGRKFRPVGCYVVVGDDRQYSTVGISQKIQSIRRDTQDRRRVTGFLHSPLRQVAQFGGPDEQAFLDHEKVELRAVPARDP